MAKRGRKPDPTAFKKLKGNPGQRRLNEDEPKPEKAPTAAQPPQHLSEHARAEWRRMYPVLRNCGLLTLADLPAFEVYCTSYGRYVAAEEVLAKAESLTVETPNGHQQAHPCVAISRQERIVAKAYLAEFGMTPSSRSRIVAGMPPPPPLDEDGETPQPADQPPGVGAEFKGLIGKRPN